MSNIPNILSPVVDGEESTKLLYIRRQLRKVGLKNKLLDERKLRIAMSIRYHEDMLAQLRADFATIKNEENGNINEYLTIYEQFKRSKGELEAEASEKKRLQSSRQ